MKNLHKTWFDYFLIVIFAIILLVTLYPFLNVLAISLNDATDTLKNVNFIVPRKFTLANYKYVFKEADIVKPFFFLYQRPWWAPWQESCARPCWPTP